MANNAKLPDLKTLLQAGINPRTGLPLKVNPSPSGAMAVNLQAAIRDQLKILDMQNAVNRYKWIDLPKGLNGQLLERILYYKGQGAFFYLEANETFYFLPYALSGTVDVYGRFLGVTPLIFAGSNTVEEKQGKDKVMPFINGMIKKPVYDIPEEEDIDEDMLLDGCVLLCDYSQQLSETVIPRAIVNNPLLEHMGEIFPLARTSLIANCGVRGIRVQDEDQASSVYRAADEMVKGALTGKWVIPITGATEFQDLTNGTPLKSEEYLLYLQALDSYRLSLYGLESGGLFQKKAHMLESEQQVNASHTKLAYDDGLERRQRFCDIVNSIWGLSIWCEESEAVVEMAQTMADLDDDTANNEDTEEETTTMEEE